MKTILFVFLAMLLLTVPSVEIFSQQQVIVASADTIFIDSTRSIDETKMLTVDSNEAEVTAFTPNGDGINDIFMKDVEIKVFNRWGKEVFYGSEGWDGKKNGKSLAADTYYYIRYNRDLNGNLVSTSKGSVTLIRR